MQYEVTPLFSTPLLKTHIGPLDPITLAWLKRLECPDSSVAQYGNEDHLPASERGFDVLNQPKLSKVALIKQSRLSVMPLTKNEFKFILMMGNTKLSGL